jgi:glycosyltransferase involved in cell wall biosynthesis
MRAFRPTPIAFCLLPFAIVQFPPLTSPGPMEPPSPNRPRRVLFVDHVTKVLGGAEVNLIELMGMREVAERWDVSCACAPGSPLATALEKLGITRHAYSLAPVLGELRIVGRRFSPVAKARGLLELRRAGRRLAAIAERVRPQALISCTNKDHFVSGAVAARSGLASVWWVNDIMSADFFSWPVRRVFLAKARRTATRLVPVSEFARRALLDQGLDGARVTTIHNGIPLERYPRSTSKLLRTQLRLAPGEPLIGIVGRLTPWKGQDFFLQIAEEWVRQGRRGRFAVIGRAFNEDQEFEQRLHDTVRQRNLSERVHFVPFQTDVAATLGNLDVLLHCSIKPEPFGRVLIEAMAVGVPVIGANAGGVPEIVTANVDGGLAPPGDLTAYVSQLVALIDSLKKREAWAAAARKTVERRFTLQRVFADFDRLLAEVCDTGQRGGTAPQS